MIDNFMLGSPILSHSGLGSYVYAIMLLLPLAAVMVIVQKNPYQALVMRGILGAIAALVYAILGGADVALTEALVGTMLAITLYAVAVRSSLVMRLGVLEYAEVDQAPQWQPLLKELRSLLKRYHLRLELVPYPDEQALALALTLKEVHALAQVQPIANQGGLAPYITLRVRRLYDIFTAELPEGTAQLKFVPGQPEPLTKPLLPGKTPVLSEDQL
jgi:putative multicomponent Na+:H+ antiporter subunit B